MTHTEALRNAAQNALDVLDEARTYTSSEAWSPSMTEECDRAIRLLTAALAAPSVPSGEPQPVAWVSPSSLKWLQSDARTNSAYTIAQLRRNASEDQSVPLYAAPQPAPAGWRPIETAPKDGRRVLIAVEGVDRAVVALWSGAVWETLDGHDWMGRAVTHWMPLPAAPAAPGGEG